MLIILEIFGENDVYSIGTNTPTNEIDVFFNWTPVFRSEYRF